MRMNNGIYTAINNKFFIKKAFNKISLAIFYRIRIWSKIVQGILIFDKHFLQKFHELRQFLIHLDHSLIQTQQIFDDDRSKFYQQLQNYDD